MHAQILDDLPQKCSPSSVYALANVIQWVTQLLLMLTQGSKIL